MFAILLKEVNDSKLINNNFGNSLIFTNFHMFYENLKKMKFKV